MLSSNRLCDNILSLSSIHPNTICTIEGNLPDSSIIIVQLTTTIGTSRAFDQAAEFLEQMLSNSQGTNTVLQDGFDVDWVEVVSGSYSSAVYDPVRISSSRSLGVPIGSPVNVTVMFAPVSCSARAVVNWLPPTPTKDSDVITFFVTSCSTEDDTQVFIRPGSAIESALLLEKLDTNYTCSVRAISLESGMGKATTSKEFESVLPSVCTGSISRSDISIQADTYPCAAGDASCYCAWVDQEGYFADIKTGCQKYYVCAASGSFYFPCPGGLLFSDARTQCDYGYNVDCSSPGPVPPSPSPPTPSPPSPSPPTPSPPTPSPPTPSPPSPPSPSPPTPTPSPDPCSSGDATCFCNYVGQDGYYANQKDGCKGYYVCAGAIHYYQLCPSYLLFNEQLVQCDYPENVDCGGVPPSPPSPPAPPSPPSPPPPSPPSPPVPSPPVPSPPAPPPSPVPPSDREYVGYFQTWSMNWASDPAKTSLANLPAYFTQVVLSFMKPDATYSGGLTLANTGIQFSSDAQVIKDAIKLLKQRNPNTKVLVAVGGATYTNFGSLNMNAIVKFVNEFGLDGVDIDFEPSNPSCQVSATAVSCTTDDLFTSVVRQMREALPRPKLLTCAVFSVGAYGLGEWANAQPPSQYTGVSINMLNAVGSQLDQLNVMSYDAGTTYNPVEALEAYSYYFSGPVTLGVEVPPEAWGGSVLTLEDLNQLTSAVVSRGTAGMMLWSIQKQSSGITPTQVSQTICTNLGLQECSCPLFCPQS